MDFFTEFFSGSNKTHDEFNTFINKKFTYFLNNSNLLLNFVSDFEDYKNGNMQNGKNKCNECEDLYILTTDIFEKYFNKISVPYNINIIQENSNSNSKTNYKDKVLYFFDLKDLKKILNAENLEKSSSDLTLFNKKRLLCKIISISFIKIYIIVKSIYQTFNIYNSLVNNDQSGFIPLEHRPDEAKYIEHRPNEAIPAQTIPAQTIAAQTIPIPTQPIPTEAIPTEAISTEAIPTQPIPTEAISTEAIVAQPIPTEAIVAQPISTEAIQDEAIEDEAIEDEAIEDETRHIEEENKNIEKNQNGGNILTDLFSKFITSKKETVNPTNTSETSNSLDKNLNPPISSPISSPINPNPLEENTKLQMSSNIFYSIFVILFDNSGTEQLSSNNFNAKFLMKNLDKMDNETFAKKLPLIIKHICNSHIFLDDFLGESCILFRDDNFKFLKFETSDTEHTEATLFIEQVDKDFEELDRFIEKKQKLFEKSLNRENKEPLLNYCKISNSIRFANYKLFNKIKANLKIMIKNYFSARANLYTNIVKEIFIFDKKSNDIISLNNKLTYKYITDISKKTKIILLDLHITIFTSLNSILSDIVNEINVIKKTESPPSESPPSESPPSESPPSESPPSESPSFYEYNAIKSYEGQQQQALKGGKTKKYKKRKITRTRRRINKSLK